MPRQHTILVCGEDRARSRTVQCLDRTCPGADVVQCPDPAGGSKALGRRRPDVIVLTPDSGDTLRTACRRAKRQYGAHTPVMVVAPEGRRADAIHCLRDVADALHVGVVRGQELVARVVALLRSKRRTDGLVRERRRLERERERMAAVYARLDEELALARKLQQSFLPQKLPELGAIRFAASLQAVGPVAGDIYDVTRLDEHTVGFYVADAVGHGVAAALLTAFVKKAIRPKVISGNTYCILPPGEVLTQLNADMLTEELHESSFVTMAYGTIDVRTYIMQYSLAGHPPGIHLATGRGPELLDHGGPLLGIMEDDFETQSVALAPGDKVVFYSDGIDEARHESGTQGVDALVKGVARHADQPLDRLFERTLREILPRSARADLRDDLTLMGIEIVREKRRKRA